MDARSKRIAAKHYSSIGGVEAQRSDGTWVVRQHKIQYLLPAFAGEEIEIKTWIENIRRVRSLRKYEFVEKRMVKFWSKAKQIGCSWM